MNGRFQLKENQQLLVGAVSDVIFVKESWFSAREPCNGDYGIDVEILCILLIGTLGLRNRQIKPVRANSMGILVEMIETGSVNISATLLYPHRLVGHPNIHFTAPVTATYRGLLVGSLFVRDVFEKRSVFQPFASQVWIWIGVTSFTIIPINFFLRRSTSLKKTFMTEGSGTENLASWSPVSQFAVSVSLWLFLLLRYYEVAVYQVRTPLLQKKIPYDTLPRFVRAVEAGEAHFLKDSYNGGTLTYINTSSNSLLHRLTQAFHRNPIRILPSEDLIFRRIREKPKTAGTIISNTKWGTVSEEFCDLNYYPFVGSAGFLSFGLSKNSKWLFNKVNGNLYGKGRSIEDTNRVLLSRNVPANKCGFKSRSQPARKILITELRGPFQIWGLCLTGFTFVLVLEMMYAWIKKIQIYESLQMDRRKTSRVRLLPDRKESNV